RLEVPGTTAALLRSAVTLQPALRWLVPILAALGLALGLALRAPPLRARLDAVALRLPGLGRSLHVHGGLRLTRLLALLATVQLPLPAALELAAPRLGNAALGLALLRARTHVAQGVDPGTAVIDAGLLPPIAAELLRGVGPDARATALAALVRLCEAEADEHARRIDRVTRAVQATVAALLVAGLWLVLGPLQP
ncbi:MAG TPA: hypothetical protein VGB85_03780, partial [Nannocystis sp.]